VVKYGDTSIKKYLKDLASDMPAPGGGSASSVTAALGVSLLLMVANFTKGKKAYKGSEKTIQKEIKCLALFKRELENLIDEDVRAYTRLARCLKQPKTFAKRDKCLKIALKDAAKVPLRICEVSSLAMKSAVVLLNKGNRNLLTDVGCGAFFLAAAFDAGRLNVEINLKYIKDKKFNSGVRRTLNTKEKEVNAIKNGVSRAMRKSLKH